MNSMDSYFDIVLRLAAIAHFGILGASFQVPYRLNWKEDLAKLTPFNRKLMWTYGSFTVASIIAFGILTWTLHDELLRGDRAAMGLAAFIGLFWTARLLVDFLYFSHSDWPKGCSFVLGHVLLTSLFFFFSTTYLGLVIWKVWISP